jgi:hypothetical protein
VSAPRYDFERELARIRRRVFKLEAVSRGDATVERVWRKGYTESKIRSVRGHYMHLIRLKSDRRSKRAA